MKKPKQRIALLILVCIAFSALLVIQLSRPNLPSHNGKNLDEWLHEINQAGSYPNLNPVNKALDAMGTNCLPFLLHYMTDLDSEWKKKASSIWSRQTIIPFPLPVAEEKSGAAYLAMMRLRGNAASIIPQIDTLRDSSPNQWMWLRGLIPQDLEHDFIAACESTNARVRSQAAWGLARGPGLSYTSSWGPGTFKTNQIVRFGFTFNGDDVDLIEKNLNHTNVHVRRASAEAIAEHIGLAKRALPALKEALKDDSEIVREAAAESVRKIETYYKSNP